MLGNFVFIWQDYLTKGPFSSCSGALSRITQSLSCREIVIGPQAPFRESTFNLNFDANMDKKSLKCSEGWKFHSYNWATMCTIKSSRSATEWILWRDCFAKCCINVNCWWWEKNSSLLCQCFVDPPQHCLYEVFRLYISMMLLPLLLLIDKSHNSHSH